VLIFVPNRNPDRQPWELQNAITENEFNSVIYVEIGNLPSKMLFNYAYWPSFLADLHYFLVDGCRKSPKLLDLLNIDISKFHSDQKKEYWKKVSNVISSDSDVYDDLESSFRSAVRKAIMRVSWNYRTAIPVYFPSHNKMSVLLPLSFSTKTEAEAALVVEYNDVSKKYTAPTILPLTIAYSNARLVCKPESDWLNQRTFEPVLDHGPKLSEEEDFWGSGIT